MAAGRVLFEHRLASPAFSLVLKEHPTSLWAEAFSHTLSGRRPFPGDHPAIEVDVTIDDDRECELLVDPSTGRLAQSPGHVRVLQELAGSRSTTPRRRAARPAARCSPSTIRSVLPAIREATQGSAVAIASRSELLIPSATLGKTKRSAARRYSDGSSTPPVNWTRSAIPSEPASSSSF